MTVVLTGPGLPRASDYAGAAISGLEEAEAEGALVFHGGTAVRERDARDQRRTYPLGDSARAVARRGARASLRSGRKGELRGHAFPHRHRARLAVADPVVGILVGSESDRERMQAALDELDARGIAWEFEVRSAHRTPDAVAEYARARRRPRAPGADLRRRASPPRCPASSPPRPTCR